MTEVVADARVSDAVVALRESGVPRAAMGVVLGSGLGAFADRLDALVRVPVSSIPHFRSPTVAGHSGGLCFGAIGGVRLACLQGRVHLYEGHAVKDVVFACRVLAALGCRSVLLTNAAGGIREGLSPGSFLLVTDHLNLTGRNPLEGIAEPFVDLTHAYDEELCAAARAAAARAKVVLHEGVYAGLVGPSYETPAEVRMLRTLGADAVGMSTVLETIALRHAGVRVAAVSCITNLAAGLSRGYLDHASVQSAAQRAQRDFEAFLREWVLGCAAMATEG